MNSLVIAWFFTMRAAPAFDVSFLENFLIRVFRAQFFYGGPGNCRDAAEAGSAAAYVAARRRGKPGRAFGSASGVSLARTRPCFSDVLYSRHRLQIKTTPRLMEQSSGMHPQEINARSPLAIEVVGPKDSDASRETQNSFCMRLGQCSGSHGLVFSSIRLVTNGGGRSRRHGH